MLDALSSVLGIVAFCSSLAGYCWRRWNRPPPVPRRTRPDERHLTKQEERMVRAFAKAQPGRQVRVTRGSMR